MTLRETNNDKKEEKREINTAVLLVYATTRIDTPADASL